MSVGGFSRILLEVSAWSFAALLGVALAAGCCAGLSRAFARMGARVGERGGRVAALGVCVLAVACLLFAQKPGGPGARAPAPRASEAPRWAAPRAEQSAVPTDLPELAARPSPFAGTDAGGLRFTGVELTPSSVVLGASWPLAERGVGETLDILGRARLDEGGWAPLAWTLPPASSPGFEVEVPTELLPDNTGTSSFFALARALDPGAHGGLPVSHVFLRARARPRPRLRRGRDS